MKSWAVYVPVRIELTVAPLVLTAERRLIKYYLILMVTRVVILVGSVADLSAAGYFPRMVFPSMSACINQMNLCFSYLDDWRSGNSWNVRMMIRTSVKNPPAERSGVSDSTSDRVAGIDCLSRQSRSALHIGFPMQRQPRNRTSLLCLTFTVRKDSSARAFW